MHFSYVGPWKGAIWAQALQMSGRKYNDTLAVGVVSVN